MSLRTAIDDPFNHAQEHYMPTIPYADRLITAREALHLLSVGSTTLYKFCRQGKLTPVKFSRRCTRFRLTEIHELIASASAKVVL